MAKKKIFKKIKEGVKKVGKAIKTATATTALVPILPFIPMMKRELKNKKVKHGNKPVEIAEAFFSNIVKRSGHFDDAYSEIYESDNFALTGAAIAGIVSGILEFIKNIKKKKDTGQPLTQAEKTMLDGAEVAAEKVEEKKQQAVEGGIGSFVMDNKIIIFVIVIIVIILAYKAIKGK